MEKRKYELVDVDKLIPYGNNARTHSEEQVEKIARSINEFGFINPVLIDGDFGIIAGHGRVMAAKKIGLKKVPCLFIEDLTETQKRAYILADNKLALDAGWDDSMLNIELSELDAMDFDISIVGFDDYMSDEDQFDIDSEYGDERKRTDNAYNLGMMEYVQFTNDFWQMPIIECDDYIPQSLVGFNYAMTSEDKQTGIHFFVDDYQFERVWNDPEKYMGILQPYQCVLSPDFSLYADMPMSMKIWNIYRSRFIGAYWQSHGLKVIPTISWAEKETFDFAFCGISVGSIVAISTIGVKENKDAMQIWRDGVDEMIKRIKPKAILIYGGEVDYDYGAIQTVYFANKVLDKWKGKR